MVGVVPDRRLRSGSYARSLMIVIPNRVEQTGGPQGAGAFLAGAECAFKSSRVGFEPSDEGVRPQFFDIATVLHGLGQVFQTSLDPVCLEGVQTGSVVMQFSRPWSESERLLDVPIRFL